MCKACGGGANFPSIKSPHSCHFPLPRLHSLRVGPQPVQKNPHRHDLESAQSTYNATSKYPPHIHGEDRQTGSGRLESSCGGTLYERCFKNRKPKTRWGIRVCWCTIFTDVGPRPRNAPPFVPQYHMKSIVLILEQVIFQLQLS